MINGAAKFGDFFNQAAAQKTILARSRQKKSFDILSQGLIGVSHLQLFLKIREDAQPPQ